MEEKKVLVESLQRYEEVIPRFSVFVGHGYGQHADAGWNSLHALRYHTYVIPECTDLKDTVACAYGRLLGRMAGLLVPEAKEGGGKEKRGGEADKESGNGEASSEDGQVKSSDDGSLGSNEDDDRDDKSSGGCAPGTWEMGSESVVIPDE